MSAYPNTQLLINGEWRDSSDGRTIPVLDPAPASDDRWTFLKWTLRPALGDQLDDTQLEQFDLSIDIDSAAGFASLRSRLKAEVARRGELSVDDVLAIVHDQIPPDIASTRRYQTLQALLNCTRRSLLPDAEVVEAQREAWLNELRSLEAKGMG